MTHEQEVIERLKLLDDRTQSLRNCLRIMDEHLAGLIKLIPASARTPTGERPNGIVITADPYPEKVVANWTESGTLIIHGFNPDTACVRGLAAGEQP